MRLWIAAAVLAAIAALGLAVVPYAVDWERYRSEIEAATADIIGYEVTIEGPIAIAFLPRPVLTAKDVTMVSRPGETIGFKLTSQQIDLGFRRAPLLVGRPIVEQLKLARPLLTLDQEASAELQSWPPNLDDWSKTFFRPELRRITIADGRLELAGRKAAKSPAVSGLSLTLAMGGAKGPVEVAGLFKTSRHRFTIEADIGEQGSDGSSTIKIDIKAQNGADETTDLNFSGVLQRQGDDAGLDGRLDLAGPDLRNGLKAISAATGYPSAFLSLAPDQPFRVESRLRATADTIETEEAKVTLSEKFGSGQLRLQLDPAPTLDLTVDLPSVRLADDMTMGDFVLNNLLSIFPTTAGEIGMRLREVVYRNDAIRGAEVKIVTDKGGVSHVERAKALLPGLVDVTFEGGVRPSETGRALNGRMTAVGDDLGEAIRWLGFPLAGEGKSWRGFSLASNVSVSNVEAALSAIDMRLDSSKVTGNASLRFSERLRLALDGDVERLNLDLYTTNSRAIDLAGRLGRQLKTLDTILDLRFQRLSWKGLSFDTAALSATAEAQHVELGSLTLRTVGDTAITVEGDVDLETEAVDLTAELTSQLPTRVLRHFDIDLPLASTHLEPLALSGWVTGKLDGFDVGMQADYDEGRWSLDGRAGWIDRQAHYDLAITASHPDHRLLADHVGLAPLIPAGDAPGPFELNGQLRLEPNGRWIAAGNAKLGPTGVTGRLIQDGPAAGRKWDARVSIGNPKKDSIAPFLTLMGLRSAGNWTPRSILGRLPRTGLRTSWLNNVDGTLSMAAKGGLAGEGINLSARLDKGFLYVDDFKAALWKGELSAEVALERRRDQPFLSLALSLDDIDAKALTDWLDIPETIVAPLSLELDVITVGHTAFDLVRSLSGTLRIDAGKGELHGTGIPKLRRALRDRAKGPVDASPLPEDPLAMPLLSFKTTSTLRRGIAAVDDGFLTVDSGMGVHGATIEGTLDLLLWIAELTLTITDEDVPTDKDPLTLRIVGSPEDPQALFLAP